MRMAKLTKCDICGLTTAGRNPEGFHEIPLYTKSMYNPDGYSDLCEDCYEEYDKVYDAALKVQRETMRKWFEEKVNERNNIRGGKIKYDPFNPQNSI